MKKNILSYFVGGFRLSDTTSNIFFISIILQIIVFILEYQYVQTNTLLSPLLLSLAIFFSITFWLALPTLYIEFLKSHKLSLKQIIFSMFTNVKRVIFLVITLLAIIILPILLFIVISYFVVWVLNPNSLYNFNVAFKQSLSGFNNFLSIWLILFANAIFPFLIFMPIYFSVEKKGISSIGKSIAYSLHNIKFIIPFLIANITIALIYNLMTFDNGTVALVYEMLITQYITLGMSASALLYYQANSKTM